MASVSRAHILYLEFEDINASTSGLVLQKYIKISSLSKIVSEFLMEKKEQNPQVCWRKKRKTEKVGNLFISSS